jgi:hypothetical protein
VVQLVQLDQLVLQVYKEILVVLQDQRAQQVHKELRVKAQLDQLVQQVLQVGPLVIPL